MQTPKTGKGSPKESPQKNSVRPTRQLKIIPSGQNSPSSSSSTHAVSRTPKDQSPKVAERKSPRSPLPEKKRPSKLSELESQISQLQDDLKKIKDQLVSSELSKKEAQADAKELRSQLVDISVKLEESQKQVCELIASNESSCLELENISKDKNEELESEIESRDEIQKLKLQLEAVELTNSELKSLKEKLSETLSLSESMKHELKGSRESEAQAQERVRETLLQLEAAKETVNALKSDASLSTEAYNCLASELEQSRARASFLEDHVCKLNADLVKAKERNQNYPIASQNSRISEIVDVNELELELQRTKYEVTELKSALEAAEIRFNQDNASESSVREAQLEEQLKKARANVEELKANLMDKETELQGISEENDSLIMKLEKSMSSQRELELENELKKLQENLTDTMAELQTVSEENAKLKTDKTVENNSFFAEIESSQSKEQEAMEKLGCMMEEVDKITRKAARASEQLELAQTENAEMEAELRKLKVQSDQWRKAAEAAASMLSPGSNGKFVERTGSLPLDNNYIRSPYLDDYEEDSYKKKNGSVLKKIGVLWKKPQKH